MSNESSQTIEQLTNRYQSLNKQKIEADTNLKNAQKQLADLKSQALEEFGTDDLDELRTKLRDMEQENERNRFEYQKKLDEIERNLESVREQYSNSQES